MNWSQKWLHVQAAGPLMRLFLFRNFLFAAYFHDFAH